MITAYGITEFVDEMLAPLTDIEAEVEYLLRWESEIVAKNSLLAILKSVNKIRERVR